MPRSITIFSALLLAACASAPAPVPYAEATKNYGCAEIATELKYLDALEKNLLVAKKDHYALSDAGAVFLSLGTNGLRRDSHMTLGGDIDAQLNVIHSNRKYMKARQHEKCR